MTFPLLDRTEFHQAARQFAARTAALGEPWRFIEEKVFGSALFEGKPFTIYLSVGLDALYNARVFDIAKSTTYAFIDL